MTVYFMRYFKRISLIILVALLSLILMNLYSLPDGKIVIKDMVLSKKNNINKYKMPDYLISFNQEINFDYLIINAIDKGIPLVFKVVLRVAETNEIWPTKVIKKEIRYYQIEYKALRKIYKIVDINGKTYEYLNILDKKVPNVDTLDDYLSELKEVQNAQGLNYKYSLGDHVARLLLGPICPELDSLDEHKISHKRNRCCIL